MPLLPSDDPDMLILSVRCPAATIDAAFQPSHIFLPLARALARQHCGGREVRYTGGFERRPCADDAAFVDAITHWHLGESPWASRPPNSHRW